MESLTLFFLVNPFDHVQLKALAVPFVHVLSLLTLLITCSSKLVSGVLSRLKLHPETVINTSGTDPSEVRAVVGR